MQKLSGYGIAFLEFDGYIKEYELGPGQQIIIDTGYLAAMSATCQIDIKTVPGIKNIMFGGEGLFNTVVTGPRTYMASELAYRTDGRCYKPIYLYRKIDSKLIN